MSRAEDLRGIALMTAAMAGFALSDAAIAVVTDRLPAGQVMLAYGAGGALCLALIARARRIPLWSPDVLLRPVVARNLCEMTGTLCVLMALATAPFVSVAAVLQAVPVAYAAAAGIWLGARIDRWQWAAVLAGFAGVLVILRPGAAFDPHVLWAVAGAAILTVRDVVTRMVPPAVDSLRLAVWGFAAVIPGGALLMALQGRADPLPGDLALLGAGILTGVAAYWAITIALRTGAPGLVTPFRYTRLLFALMIGVAVLGERPDALTLAGAAVIVAAGLVTLGRAR